MKGTYDLLLSKYHTRKMMINETIIAWLKVRAHKLVDIIDLYQFNKSNREQCAICKRLEIRNVAREHNCNVLVETGTYLGEMLEFQNKNFEKLISIEISDFYYEFSRKRLKKYNNIFIKKGNSGDLLKEVVEKLDSKDKALFWLDGHYSGGNTGRSNVDSPVIEELKAIKDSNRKDVILIDDARCFNGRDGYPSLEWVEDFCIDNDWGFACYNDMIKIVPR